MHYVENHLTKHHLFHAPHKWFMALLASPIHLAELHYKNHYHMKFENARKLFVFDMTLLISIIVLIIGTAYWFLYNPEITSMIELSAKISENKIRSGDYSTISIQYKNNSDEKITSLVLTAHLPEGFILDKAEPDELFDKTSRAFKLNSLPSGHSGVAEISGWSFGVPDKEEKITTELAYQQEDRALKETKKSTTYLTHRGSILDTTVVAEPIILAQGKTLIKIAFKNTGNVDLNQLELSFPISDQTKITNAKTETGQIANNTWQIDKLSPNSSASLEAVLVTNLDDAADTIDIIFTPKSKINQSIIDLSSAKYSAKVIHPKINMLSFWSQDQNFAKPSEMTFLTVSLENNGDSNLKNVTISLPIPEKVINNTKSVKINKGSLAIGQKTDVLLKLPIADMPQGDRDLVLELIPTVSAQIDNINTNYETSAKAPALKIGTALNLSAETRYYTAEGDQLGRGPLPPQVGKETKYWALLRITNSTSMVKNVKLSAVLPDYVVWTGKSSVSQGQDLVYNTSDKTISWQTNSLEPQTEVGLYFEVALTPTQAQINTTPVLVKDIILTGHDTYIDTNITKIKSTLDASIPNDIMGKNKGVKVR